MEEKERDEETDEEKDGHAGGQEEVVGLTTQAPMVLTLEEVGTR